MNRRIGTKWTDWPAQTATGQSYTNKANVRVVSLGATHFCVVTPGVAAASEAIQALREFIHSADKTGTGTPGEFVEGDIDEVSDVIPDDS